VAALAVSGVVFILTVGIACAGLGNKIFGILCLVECFVNCLAFLAEVELYERLRRICYVCVVICG
jgi:hypothetical protein